ncbi:hypothetical protein [Streptomyces sp. NPDC058108]
MSQLREDRILDEALTSADPLRLTRLFCIDVSTAWRYLATARPDPDPSRP